MTHVDLAIIGSGSGNAIPPELDHLSIALIEEGRFGGTCLNVGCLPTKMFVHPADVIAQARRAARLGVDLELRGVDFVSIRDRVFGRIDPIADGGEHYRRAECPNIQVFDSHARFVGERTLRTADGDEISAAQVIVAAGSRPAIPEVVRACGVDYLTNETIMRLDAPPARLLILGSGYIACEFAHVFSAYGSRVTITGRSDVLLKHQDRTIAERFTAHAREVWDVRLSTHVTAIERVNGEIVMHFEDGTTACGDALLVATGRIPNGDRMDLHRAGIQTHDDGRIRVDEYGRTSAPGVWALGDVSSPYQLKHVANREAKVVFHNVVHPHDLRAITHHAVPAAVFTDPQIASVGLTEEAARAAGYDVAVACQEFGDVGFGWALEDEIGLCKVIADRATGRLLGAHLIGYESAILIQGLVQTMALDTDVRDMANGQYWIHPALSEVVENALLSLDLPR
ncbi:MAG: mycothione reductase [Bowdeniella nasicola]|nr:mycothione reductase [Bowdeniella nasicola]